MDVDTSYKVAPERAKVINHDPELSFVQAHLEDIQDYRILDITVNGFSQAALFQAVGADVISITADAETSGSRLPPPNAMSERMLWLDEKSFDIVICPLLLSWQTHLSKMSEQCYRVLKHSGHLLFSLGSSTLCPPANPLWQIDTRYRENISYHSCSSIINTLLATGFQLEQALPIRQSHFSMESGCTASVDKILNEVHQRVQSQHTSERREDEFFDIFQDYGILQPGVLGFKMLKSLTF